MTKQLTVAAALVASAIALGAQAPAKQTPTVDQILSIKRAGSPAISPDAHYVAYTVRASNWDDNAFDTQIWIADATTGATRQLTNSKKSSQSPAWSPDGMRLAFISDRSDKRQIYVINPLAGEAEAVTSLEDGVGSFEWAPDGKSIAYTATDAKSAAVKDRDKKYGEFQVVEQDFRMTHLYVIDLAAKTTKTLTSGAFTVGSFSWSPNGRSIAFDHRVNPLLASGGSADISIVTVADASIRPLVTQDGPDTDPIWSPDGSRIAFHTSMANPAFFYTNSVIATVPASGGAPTVLTSAFDEDPSMVAWKPNGIYFAAAQKTYSYLYKLDPASKAIAKMPAPNDTVNSGFSLSKDGDTYASLRADAKSMSELYVGQKKLTDMNAQSADWTTSTLEVVSWTGVSRAIPFTSTIYPIDIWVPRGILVLEPNYRGSAGYGETFRALNVRNLGVGDAWDVLSGVDALVAKGIVDPARVGTMGWSQGGYISAFLATHDAARFKAISVGAGISDWTTYYVNTDITPFTRQYLKATPWDDPAIYAKTSPITYIKQAKTPTLIQHGATDQRVPLPDAYELYRGLQDNHVPSKLIVYQGFAGIGHGPSKPKSFRATMDHNLEWFEQYMFASAEKTTAAPAK
jgi:dipeptidyl aminopeptidase/acylaminoacyl peptidase